MRCATIPAMSSVIRSRLWQYPSVVLNILRHPFQQEVDTLLSNERVFLHCIGDATTSYCVLAERRGYRHLKDVFTFEEFRGRGYATLLLTEALADADKPVYVMCRRPLVPFYARLGFAPADRPPPALAWRAKLLTAVFRLLTGRVYVVMIRSSRSLRAAP